MAKVFGNRIFTTEKVGAATKQTYGNKTEPVSKSLIYFRKKWCQAQIFRQSSIDCSVIPVASSIEAYQNKDALYSSACVRWRSYWHLMEHCIFCFYYKVVPATWKNKFASLCIFFPHVLAFFPFSIKYMLHYIYSNSLKFINIFIWIQLLIKRENECK